MSAQSPPVVDGNVANPSTPSRAKSPQNAQPDYSPHPTSTPGQMKRRLRAEWQHAPIPRHEMIQLKRLVEAYSNSQDRTERYMHKKSFNIWLQQLSSERDIRAMEFRNWQKRVAERAEAALMDKNRRIGNAKKAQKAAIANRAVKLP